MILVDTRTGSKHLAPALEAAGLQVDLAHLEFGDVAFQGRGPEGQSVDIGVELKTVNDLLASLRSGRFSGHQLPGLDATYDYVWLLIEGIWQHDEHGQLTLRDWRKREWKPARQKYQASELDKQLLTLELRGGLYVRSVFTPKDTVRFVVSLYRWWTDQAFEQHSSHLGRHMPGSIVALSPRRQALCSWPGIGTRLSLAAEREFRSVKRAANASATQWAKVATVDDKGKTRRLGPRMAQKLVAFLEEET